MLVPRRLRLPGQRTRAQRRLRTSPLDEDDVLPRDRRPSGGKASRRSASPSSGRFSHPDHERRVGEILAKELPDVHVTLSVDLLPQIREYTRTSTVAVNAYVAPGLARYVGSIERMLTELGYANPIRYFQSNGGLTSGAVFSRRAVSALNSGPAAGPSAALHYAASLDQTDVVSVDVGGTSSDISLVKDGKVDLVKDVDIDRYRVGVPLVNVISIGAGRRIDRLDRRAGTPARRATERRGACPARPATCEAEPRPP